MPKTSIGPDSGRALFVLDQTAGRGTWSRLKRVLHRTVVLAVLYVGTPSCLAFAIVGAHHTIGARQDVVRYSAAQTCSDGRTRDCLRVQSSTVSRIHASYSGENPTTDVYLRIPGIPGVEETIVDENLGSTLKPGEAVTTTRWNGPTVLIVADGLRLTTEAGPQNGADKQEAIGIGGFLASVVLLRILGWRWFGRSVDRARFRRIDLMAVPALVAVVSVLYLACAYTAGFWAISAGSVAVLLSSTAVPCFAVRRRAGLRR